jgi:hypothetical protein
MRTSTRRCCSVPLEWRLVVEVSGTAAVGLLRTPHVVGGHVGSLRLIGVVRLTTTLRVLQADVLDGEFRADTGTQLLQRVPQHGMEGMHGHILTAIDAVLAGGDGDDRVVTPLGRTHADALDLPTDDVAGFGTPALGIVELVHVA